MVMSSIRLLLIAGLATASSAAFAQVPVADSQRQGKEKSIADCFTASKTYKKAQEQPQGDIQKSVASPGQGASPVQAGKDVVSGVGTQAGGSTISGMDLSGISTSVPAGLSSGSMFAGAANATNANFNTAAQVVASLSGLNGAAGNNNSGLTTAAGLIGTMAGIQGAWNQNTANRIAAGSVWNQYLQLASVTAQLFNQRLVNRNTAASIAAQIMTYEAQKATLTGDAAQAQTSQTGN
jgi:hypothetical protein